MIYIFECGCILQRTHVSLEGTKIVCPKHHWARLAARQTFCQCGEVLLHNTNGRVTQRCKACEKEYQREYQQKYNKVRRYGGRIAPGDEKYITSEVAPKRKCDCKYYDRCLVTKLEKNYRACQGCPDYKYQPLDAADYMKKYSFSEQTSHNTYPER